MKRISSLFKVCSLVVWASATLSACATLERSGASGYRSERFETDFSRDRKQRERQTIMNELGDQDSLSPEAYYLRRSLLQAEKTLEGKREREQYFHHKPYLRNDQERLQFLSLPSFEARQKWLNSSGIQTGPGMVHSAPIQALIELNDITVGMTKQAVRESWGEPENTEVAGNPIYGNERWQYKEETSSTDGYQTQERWVYFESGRVIGWETR